MPNQQYTSTRPTHRLFLTFDKQTKSAVEWAKQLDFPVHVIYNRLSRGWTQERTLTTPKSQNNHIYHGLSQAPTASTYYGMMYRCYNPKMPAFRRYGGRGIVVCGQMRTLVGFSKEVGERPSLKHSLDRKDNEGGYWCGRCTECVGNCWPKNWRWATKRDQQNNTCRNRRYTFDGQVRTLAEWARIYGITRNCLLKRTRRGWTMEKALLTPVQAERPFR